MKKYFKTNTGYFNFINTNKNNIEVIQVDKTKKMICCIYKFI